MLPKPVFIITIIAATLTVGWISIRGQVTNAVQAPIQGDAPGAILVELFTSEGCSSCPPADALLRQIDGKRTESGQLVVGVSEHVTYWNQLGWSDPFSDSAYTDRQDAYGKRFHLDSVYTPQMVINGQEQFVGNDSASLLRAIQKEHQQSPLSIQINAASINKTSLTVAFSVVGNVEGRGADIFAIVADDTATSNVLRGENSGHTLSHTSVARAIARVSTVKASTERTVHVPLSSTERISSGERHQHLILFAQTVGFGRVLAVATKPL